MHKLLKSYLTEKKQFVNFREHESDWKGVEVEVPQSSALGLLLFLVYKNDLQNNNNSLKVLNFAKNTLLHTTFKKTVIKQTLHTLIQKLIIYQNVKGQQTWTKYW